MAEIRREADSFTVQVTNDKALRKGSPVRGD